MTVRVFTDTDGSPWQVWAVRPPSPDRRSGEDRRAHSASDPWHERRRAGERRVRDVGRPAAVAGEFARGWLCFEVAAPEVASLRRRLAPIPTDWEECPEAALRTLLGRAAPATRAGRSGQGTG